MSRLRMVGFGVGAVVLFVVGVLSVRSGDTVIAVMMLAFGSACAGGAVLARPPAAPEEALGPGSIMLGDRRLEGFVLPFSSRRAWVAVFMAGAFVVMGVAIALDGAVLVGVAVAATFAIMGLLGVANARRGSGHLVFGEDTLAHVSATSAAVLRWDDVESWRTYDIRGTPMLGLWGPAETHGVSQLFSRMARSYGDLVIPMSAVGVDPEWLEDLVARCVEDPASRRAIAAGAVPPHPSG